MSEKNVRRRGRRDKKKKGQLLNNIILVIAIAVFVFSGIQLWGILKEYRAGSSEYDNIQSMAVQVGRPVKQDTELEVPPSFIVDFDKLLSINKDTVAWLRFDNPDTISYPVVASSNNADYLYTTFEGKHNSAGSIFVDYRSKSDFSESNTVIHGHNMKNGSMFGQLRKYRSAEFCQENPYFYIYLPDGREVKYQIFAACVVKDTSKTYDMAYENVGEFQEYLNYVKNCALYDTGVDVSVEHQIVTLSTCTSRVQEERLVVHGVKIDERIVGE